MERAAESIDTGAALNKLQKLAEFNSAVNPGAVKD
jgi:anthranilate phosphoribosyltransferase